MKVWYVLADDCEAVVVDETATAAATQLGYPDARVWEEKPVEEFGGIGAYVLPGVGMPLLVKPDCKPLVLYWRAREA